MARQGIILDDTTMARARPLVVPRSLFTTYQPTIGGTAVLLWLNMYESSEYAADNIQVPTPSELARRMGINAAALERAQAALVEAGLLSYDGTTSVLHWPADDGPADAAPADLRPADERPADEPPARPVPVVATDEVAAGAETLPRPESVVRAPEVAARPASPPAEVAVATKPRTREEVAPAGAPEADPDEAALKAVVEFYHQRIGLIGPSQFEKLRFWVEEQQMSPDVVALAIEETVQSARTPRMAYLEGILRNWRNDGIRTLEHLQRNKRVRSLTLPPRTEGAPNASAYEAVDPDQVRRFKEMYADEYDG